MFRYVIAALALLASPCVAQTVTSAKPLPVKNGTFTLYNDAPRVLPPQKRGTKVYGPCGVEGARTVYSLTPECPGAVPPVVIPPVNVPPVVGPELTMKNGTVFFRDAALTGAINTAGTLASAESVPAGWPTASDEDGAVSYIGLKAAGWKYDLIARGAPIDIDALSYVVAGERVELRGTGFGANAFVGSNAGLTWTGKAGCFDIVKAKAIGAGRISETVTLTNARCAAATDVRFLHAIDPDQDRSMANVFTIADRGTVVAAAPGIGAPTITLSSADPRATAYGVPNLLLPKTTNAAFNATPKVGSITKGDGDAILMFRLGEIATGTSVSLSLGTEVR